MVWNSFQAIVMMVQNRYQRRRMYTRIALGKNSAMDVVGGESSGGKGQLLLLYPMLFGECSRTDGRGQWRVVEGQRQCVHWKGWEGDRGSRGKGQLLLLLLHPMFYGECCRRDGGQGQCRKEKHADRYFSVADPSAHGFNPSSPAQLLFFLWLPSTSHLTPPAYTSYLQLSSSGRPLWALRWPTPPSPPTSALRGGWT